jgi:hypothetical protein
MRTEGISPLRRRMIEDMTARNLPPTNRRVYIHNVRALLLHVSPHIHFGDPTGIDIPFIVYAHAFW